MGIAGNCEMESMRSMAVLIGRAKGGRGQRNCKEIGWGEELEAWPRHSAPSLRSWQYSVGARLKF